MKRKFPRFVLFAFVLGLLGLAGAVSANPIPGGACCFSDGTCELLDNMCCSALGGAYMGDESVCEPNPCNVPWACCLPDGTCQMLIAAECVAAPGFYNPGLTCTPCNPCPQTMVACCVPEGGCQLMWIYLCCQEGWQYFLAPCVPDPCPPTPTEKGSWGRLKKEYQGGER